ncbi:MAG: hypothetical protein HUU22_05390 [Phycisphaerae bacterium]|nr:hypothetical protein [Phycisphaerae bacterium]NUQ45447.1 hypothetical protein [Phycisphaerae bacterium]
MPDTLMNENSASPGSGRLIVYDLPLVPAELAAFHYSRTGGVSWAGLQPVGVCHRFQPVVDRSP